MIGTLTEEVAEHKEKSDITNNDIILMTSAVTDDKQRFLLLHSSVCVAITSVPSIDIFLIHHSCFYHICWSAKGGRH